MGELRKKFESETGLNDDSESSIGTYCYKEEYIEWLEKRGTQVKRKVLEVLLKVNQENHESGEGPAMAMDKMVLEITRQLKELEAG